MKYTSIIILLILITNCSLNEKKDKEAILVGPKKTSKEIQDSIIEEVFKSDVLKTEGFFSTEWQDELTKALQKDSTIAYLWQQKAMPLFKQGKYELGMPYLDKAVQYNEQQWLEYRGFMKCIFAKSYSEAIADFEVCQKKYGNSYVMDHSYTFYIALS